MNLIINFTLKLLFTIYTIILFSSLILFIDTKKLVILCKVQIKYSSSFHDRQTDRQTCSDRIRMERNLPRGPQRYEQFAFNSPTEAVKTFPQHDSLAWHYCRITNSAVELFSIADKTLLCRLYQLTKVHLTCHLLLLLLLTQCLKESRVQCISTVG